MKLFKVNIGSSGGRLHRSTARSSVYISDLRSAGNTREKMSSRPRLSQAKRGLEQCSS